MVEQQPSLELVVLVQMLAHFHLLQLQELQEQFLLQRVMVAQRLSQPSRELAALMEMVVR
jgi:hypothetical protein